MQLQAIQCMDVAEQALQALEMLSKKHNKAILHAVSICMSLGDVTQHTMYGV
jgi:E3 ubiquitin-protein ligase TRIP12